MNAIKTVLLMGVMTGLLVGVGSLIAGEQGMILALVLAGAMNFVGYWFSDKIILKLYRAQPVTEAEAPQLYRIVRNLAQRANLPMPTVCVIADPSPNAFATGRDPQHAVVAVTEGLMRILTEDELEGVIAHELAHVQNRDMLIGAMAATLAGALLIMVRIFAYASIFFGGRDRQGGGFEALAMLIIAPIAAMLIQMAISRSREYQADAVGARLTQNPGGLARALAKLQQASQMVPMQQANPNTAHLFIVSPLRGKSLFNLFSTHPPMEERINRLQNMAARGYVE